MSGPGGRRHAPAPAAQSCGHGERHTAAGARARAVVDGYLHALAVERNLSAYTLRNYRTDLAHYLDWLDGAGHDLLSVTRPLFRSYLAALDSVGVARASIARKVTTIHTLYRHLVDDGTLPADPLHGVRPPKPDRRLPRVLPPSAVADLLDAPDGDGPQALRDRAMLELLYAAGVRVSELARVDTADLDLDEDTLRVTGKGNKQRVVLFGVPAARALAAYLRDGRPRLAAGRAQPALFLNRDGGRLSTRSVQEIVRRSAAAAGIDAHVHPHLLRHTFATHLLDGGADVRVVQELLGHARATTTQVYTHVTEARQREVYTDAFYAAWHPRAARSVPRRRATDAEPPARDAGTGTGVAPKGQKRS